MTTLVRAHVAAQTKNEFSSLLTYANLIQHYCKVLIDVQYRSFASSKLWDPFGPMNFDYKAVILARGEESGAAAGNEEVTQANQAEVGENRSIERKPQRPAWLRHWANFISCESFAAALLT